MNSKGEATLTGWVIPILVLGLIVGIISSMVDLSSNVYDTSGFDNESIAKYNNATSLSRTIQTASNETDNLVVDANLFDFFAGIWNKLTSPFKSIYQSFNTVNTLTSNASDDLMLLPEVKAFLITSITLLVLLLIWKIYLARNL